MKPLVQKTLQLAQQRVGVREIGHSNTGVEVSKWLRQVGTANGAPWCAAFTWSTADDAAEELDVQNPIIRSAYTPDIGNWARREQILIPCIGKNGINRPEEGDLFLVHGPTRFHHVGYVRAVHRHSWGSIEGNSNSNGSRDGYEVAANDEKPFASRFWWVRWSVMCEDAVAKPKTRELFLGGKKVADLPVAGNISLCPVRKWCKWMGKSLEWHKGEEPPLSINGESLESEISLIDEESYVAIRDLVALDPTLKVRFDAVNQRVFVDRV